jgi:hypothetical protein
VVSGHLANAVIASDAHLEVSAGRRRLMSPANEPLLGRGQIDLDDRYVGLLVQNVFQQVGDAGSEVLGPRRLDRDRQSSVWQRASCSNSYSPAPIRFQRHCSASMCSRTSSRSISTFTSQLTASPPPGSSSCHSNPNSRRSKLACSSRPATSPKLTCRGRA